MVTMWLYTTILVGYIIKSGLTLTAAAADRQCAATSMQYYYMTNTFARGGDHVEWVRAVCARLGGKVYVVVVEH